MKLLLLSFCLLLLSCSSSSNGPEESTVGLYFSPDELSLSIGEEVVVGLHVSDCSQPVFGVSLQLEYNFSVVSFNAEQGLTTGDFFPDETITFCTVDDSLIYLTHSLVQGEDSVAGSGLLVSFRFSGIISGECSLQLNEETIIFYDEAGAVLEFEEPHYGSATLTVN